MRDPSPLPHLGDDKLPGDQQRPQQVVSAIISHFVDGHLKTKRASEGNPRFSEATCLAIFIYGSACCRCVTCEPVRMIGLPRFSHMKERAEAVYAIVSVP